MNPPLVDDLRGAVRAFFEANRDIVFAKAKVKPGPDQEKAVHELRVATKKIRTAFRLVQFIAPDRFRQKKEIAGLRTLFRAAGPLRELQVDESVVWNYELLHIAYHRRLSQLLRAETKSAQPYYESERKAFDQATLLKPGKLLLTIVHGMPEEELLAKTLALYYLRMGQMHQVMPNTYEVEMIHKARIYLKEAMYLMGLLVQAGYAHKLKPGLLEAAKATAEIAGDWHDREVFYQWLQIQLRPDGALFGKDRHYRMLLQDLHNYTRSQVVGFRKALKAISRIEMPETLDLVQKTNS
jgi:CHAD domain-containing protein